MRTWGGEGGGGEDQGGGGGMGKGRRIYFGLQWIPISNPLTVGMIGDGSFCSASPFQSNPPNHLNNTP